MDFIPQDNNNQTVAPQVAPQPVPQPVPQVASQQAAPQPAPQPMPQMAPRVADTEQINLARAKKFTKLSIIFGSIFVVVIIALLAWSFFPDAEIEMNMGTTLLMMVFSFLMILSPVFGTLGMIFMIIARVKAPKYKPALIVMIVYIVMAVAAVVLLGIVAREIIVGCQTP